MLAVARAKTVIAIAQWQPPSEQPNLVRTRAVRLGCAQFWSDSSGRDPRANFRCAGSGVSTLTGGWACALTGGCSASGAEAGAGADCDHAEAEAGGGSSLAEAVVGPWKAS